MTVVQAEAPTNGVAAKKRYTKHEVERDASQNKFKYAAPLPLHGELATEIPADADANKVTEDIVAKLSAALTGRDAKAFAGLFLDTGVWRDRSVFTWEYRTFNFPDKIEKAAADLLPVNNVTKVAIWKPEPKILRLFPDLSFVQAHLQIDTDKVQGSALLNIVLDPQGQYRIWTLNTVIEGLQDFPELPDSQDHYGGPLPWAEQYELDKNLEGVEPDVVIIGGGQNGIITAARLKALGVKTLIVERNKRIGDNWRNRYQALRLQFPYYADHLPYLKFPRHWPKYAPAGKLADFLEFYASAFELPVWTDSTVVGSSQDANGQWTLEIKRGDKEVRTFKPKKVVLATSLLGNPYTPPTPGLEGFKGKVIHSSEFTTTKEFKDKKVLVVGTASSGIDIAEDFARVGTDVTLLQRSPTYIMTLKNAEPLLLAPFFPDQDGNVHDVETADRLHVGLPHGPYEKLAERLTTIIEGLDEPLLKGLTERGFELSSGQNGAGIVTNSFTRVGGFYFETGGAQAIVDGKIKVEKGEVESFNGDKVRLTNGKEEQYDLVVFATGFTSVLDSVSQILGKDTADKIGQIWGLDEEGETVAAWRTETGVDNLWIAVGYLQLARAHTKTIALRIKAQLEGLVDQPYRTYY